VTLYIIEWGKNQCGAELTFIQQVVSFFIIGIHADGNSAADLLGYACVKVVGFLRLNRRTQINCSLIASADELRQISISHQFERWRGKVLSIPGMQRRGTS